MKETGKYFHKCTIRTLKEHTHSRERTQTHSFTSQRSPFTSFKSGVLCRTLCNHVTPLSYTDLLSTGHFQRVIADTEACWASTFNIHNNNKYPWKTQRRTEADSLADKRGQPFNKLQQRRNPNSQRVEEKYSTTLEFWVKANCTFCELLTDARQSEFWNSDPI